MCIEHSVLGACICCKQEMQRKTKCHGRIKGRGEKGTAARPFFLLPPPPETANSRGFRIFVAGGGRKKGVGDGMGWDVKDLIKHPRGSARSRQYSNRPPQETVHQSNQRGRRVEKGSATILRDCSNTVLGGGGRGGEGV